MNIQRGVYRRGDIWWYSVGRGVRRSSRSRDIGDAMRLREQAIEAGRQARIAREFSLTAPPVVVDGEWAAAVARQRADSNSWLRRTHTRMQRRSVRRCWPDCLTLTEFRDLVLASDGRCALTGIRFSGSESGPFSISVDRIDSAKGYWPGNVRCVLLAVNLGMSRWGEEPLRRIARALAGRELISSEALRENMYIHTGYTRNSKTAIETDG